MKTITKLLVIGLVISVLFLIIAVDYIPHTIAWLPLLITGYLSLNNEEFVEWFSKKVDNLV